MAVDGIQVHAASKVLMNHAQIMLVAIKQQVNAGACMCTMNLAITIQSVV